MSILTLIPAFFNMGTGEILIITLVVLLLFGGKKIPELMRGLGKGVSSFKKGMNEITEELKTDPEEAKKASKAAEADEVKVPAEPAEKKDADEVKVPAEAAEKKDADEVKVPAEPAEKKDADEVSLPNESEENK